MTVAKDHNIQTCVDNLTAMLSESLPQSWEGRYLKL